MSDLHLDFIDYKKVFKNRETRLSLINKLSFIPTPLYLKIVYYIKTGRRLNLNNPVLFEEKLNWLKIHDRNPEYKNYVDKAYMKEYISNRFGSEFIIPTLGLYNHFDEINFDKLPNQFVLKCTHDSGSVKIIKDKKEIDKEELKNYFENRLSITHYNIGREYSYKGVKPRIIAEEYYETKDGYSINDYKLMCFNGKVKVFYVISGKGTDRETQAWYDGNCSKIDVIDRTIGNANRNIEIPKSINRMFEIAEELSKGIKFVRVDFFVDKEKFYFGEMTFYNNGGFVLLEPEKWEYCFGNLIDINE